jgi:hypothetical protein
MAKSVKIYKPTHEEILKNVLGSFEIENIKISYSTGKKSLRKVLNKIKKENV